MGSAGARWADRIGGNAHVAAPYLINRSGIRKDALAQAIKEEICLGASALPEAVLSIRPWLLDELVKGWDESEGYISGDGELQEGLIEKILGRADAIQDTRLARRSLRITNCCNGTRGNTVLTTTRSLALYMQGMTEPGSG